MSENGEDLVRSGQSLSIALTLSSTQTLFNYLSLAPVLVTLWIMDYGCNNDETMLVTLCDSALRIMIIGGKRQAGAND